MTDGRAVDTQQGVPPITTETLQENANVQYYSSDEPMRLGIENFNRGNFGVAERYFQDATVKASRAHPPSIRTLILQSFLAKLSNGPESLTVDVRYLALSIADDASRFWSAAFVYRCTSLRLAWPAIAAISCMVHHPRRLRPRG